MRITLCAALFAAAIGWSVADEPKKDDAKSVKDQIAAMKAEFEKTSAKLKKEFGEAKTQDEKTKIREEFFKMQAEVGKKALDLAKANAKDAAAFDALEMAMQMGGPKIAKDATDVIISDFINHPKLAKMLPMFAQGPDGSKMLGTIAEKTTDKSVKGAAKYYMLTAEVEAADQPEGKPSAKETAAKLDAAAAKLAELLTNHGDVKIEGNDGEQTIAEAGKKLKFFLENLVVGKMAPDVECELLDGKKAKLSDYKGKVVVLDIWATWCGPCRAMIPHEREMVEKRKDKKFVLISVSADQKKETLTKFLEKEEMPWTHWWDGGAKTVTEKFQVQFFPTIYIIDAKGVIRAKHTRGKAMDEVVDELLKELEPKG